MLVTLLFPFGAGNTGRDFFYSSVFARGVTRGTSAFKDEREIAGYIIHDFTHEFWRLVKGYSIIVDCDIGIFIAGSGKARGRYEFFERSDLSECSYSLDAVFV